MTRIPDFSSLHEIDEAVNKLWKLRRSRDVHEFRRWFRKNVRSRPEEAATLFYQTLGKSSLGANPVFRIIRYLVFNVVPTLLGAGPKVTALGLAASAADSFLVDRFMRPSAPKVMIDRFRAGLPSIGPTSR